MLPCRVRHGNPAGSRRDGSGWSGAIVPRTLWWIWGEGRCEPLARLAFFKVQLSGHLASERAYEGILQSAERAGPPGDAIAVSAVAAATYEKAAPPRRVRRPFFLVVDGQQPSLLATAASAAGALPFDTLV